MTRIFTPDEIAVLIAKLEAANGANFEIENAICELLGLAPEGFERNENGGWTRYDSIHDNIELWNPPAYTYSMDAALRLVPDGCNYLLGRGRTRPDEPIFGAIIFSGPFHDNETKLGEGEHDGLLAIALCIAALKARAALAGAP